jgi:hypothetical protein
MRNREWVIGMENRNLFGGYKIGSNFKLIPAFLRGFA